MKGNKSKNLCRPRRNTTIGTGNTKGFTESRTERSQNGQDRPSSIEDAVEAYWINLSGWRVGQESGTAGLRIS